MSRLIFQPKNESSIFYSNTYLDSIRVKNESETLGDIVSVSDQVTS